MPSVETLYAICKELDVLPSYLMLGIGPKSQKDSSQTLEPVPLPDELRRTSYTHGVDQWLSEHPELSEDDKAWMRAVPWPQAHVRQPDLVYLTVLTAYKQAQGVRAPKEIVQARNREAHRHRP